MTAQEFWYEDCRLINCYIKAYNDRINEAAWLNGMYVFDAISCAIHNKMPSAVAEAIAATFGKKSLKHKPLHYQEKPIEPSRKEKLPVVATTENNALSGVAAWSQRIKQLKGMEA